MRNVRIPKTPRPTETASRLPVRVKNPVPQPALVLAPEVFPAFRGRGRTVQELEAAKIAILPAMWASEGTRARNDGPRALLAASQWLGGFEEDAGLDPVSIGIATLAPVSAPTLEPFLNDVRQRVRDIRAHGKLPVVLGADRIASLAAVQAIREQDETFAVLQVDARAHIQNEGTMFGPITHYYAYSLAKQLIPTVMFGLRGLAEVELAALSQGKASFYTARRLEGRDATSVAAELVRLLPRHLYITIDLSVLDSGLFPAVELPLPWGLDPSFIAGVLRPLVASRRIVGLDICGLAPIPSNPAPNAIAAGLLNRLLAAAAKSLA